MHAKDPDPAKDGYFITWAEYTVDPFGDICPFGDLCFLCHAVWKDYYSHYTTNELKQAPHAQRVSMSYLTPGMSDG